jgi:tungstate transport system substrate-binding protein
MALRPLLSGRRRALGAGLAAVLAFALAACSGSAATPAPTAAPSPAGSRDLILATTTSTQDSGLLDVLVPAFDAQSGYSVKTVAVGSGAALKLGTDGNADVLLVHSPAAEKDFMAAGSGVDRRLVMHNTFLIVGPAADPAGIKGLTSASDAFKKIAASKSPFVSRGDGSGTETKELGYWKALGITPDPAWYIKSGQGMGATLQIASEKRAYTLTDIATWAATQKNLQLVDLVDKDPSLLNIYHVIAVNPAKWPKVNAAGATAFEDYLVSPAGQQLIGAFGQDKYGMQLFVPDAGKSENSLTTP